MKPFIVDLEIRERAPVARHPAIEGEVTPERFARLTAHLRVNGKPVENVLHRLQTEKRGEAVAAESAPS